MTSKKWKVLRNAPPPPPSRRVEIIDRLHGEEVSDPFRWLEDHDAPETRSWIVQQNAYTDSILDPLPGRESIEARLKELLHADRRGLPIVRGQTLFYSRRAADDDLALICKRDVDEEEIILVDPHSKQEFDPVNVEILDLSFDGRLLAYSVRSAGRDETTIMFLDTVSRNTIRDFLPRARYFSVIIAPDGQSCFYTKHTRSGPRLFQHLLGTPVSTDRLLFGRRCDAGKILYCRSNPPSRILLITVLHGSAADRTELYLLDMENPQRIRTVSDTIPCRVLAELADPWLFIWTNENAERGRIMRIDASVLDEREEPNHQSWKEIIPEADDAVIHSMSAAGGLLWVNYLKSVSTVLRVFSPDGECLRTFGEGEIATLSVVSGTWATHRVFFSRSSFHLPPSIVEVDSRSIRSDTRNEKQGTRATANLWTHVDIPVDPSAYELTQHWYRSKDGTRVPAFLFYRKGLERNGRNPTLLTGYGGFNSPQLPTFSATAMTWVDHGGIFVVAGLRGGGELGESWHAAGMRRNKQNVFDDFIAAAEYLIAERFASPQTLAISGGSNGGLLVAAAMTQRPDLFAAVVCSYPLLDMIRYHKFSVAQFWIPEFGCADDKDDFDILYAYSPYHRVRPGEKYPSCLLISGDGDTRVAPLHARKMAAILQSAASPEAPTLLRYHTNAGHAGHVPVSESIRNASESLLYLLWRTAP